MLDITYLSFIGVSVLVGLMCTKASSRPSYKLLLLFLIITLINETLCYFLKKQGTNTQTFYNLYYYLRFPILGYTFRKIFPCKGFYSKLILAFNYITVILLFVCLYLYGINRLHVIYLMAGGVFIIVLCLLYFLRLVRNDKFTNPFATPLFWASTGFFFYFLGVLPFLGVINFLVKEDMVSAEQMLFINKTLSIMLYSLIGIDFYTQWKQQKLKYRFT